MLGLLALCLQPPGSRSASPSRHRHPVSAGRRPRPGFSRGAHLPTLGPILHWYLSENFLFSKPREQDRDWSEKPRKNISDENSERMICSRGRGPGQWWPLDCTPHWNDPPVGQKTPVYSAELYCPSCGQPTAMTNHAIAPEGQVVPSFVECPDKVRCGKTHEMLTLVGWTDFLASKSPSSTKGVI